MKEIQSDPFLVKIRSIVLSSVNNQAGQGFRSAIVSEVQAYSQLVEEQQEISQLFLEICDLLLDCESKNIPDNSFKILIANLVHEHSFFRIPSESEILELTGMSALELSRAGEALKEKECSVLKDNPIMNRGRKARRKNNSSRLEGLEERRVV